MRQTGWTAADHVWCEKLATACSVTASVVNYLHLAVIGDRHVGIYASPDNWRTCRFLSFFGLGVTPEPKFTKRGDDLLATQLHHTTKFHRPVSTHAGYIPYKISCGHTDTQIVNDISPACLSACGDNKYCRCITARRSYASAVLRVVIVSVSLSVCPSVRLLLVCFVTKPNNTLRMFCYHTKAQPL